MRSAQLFPAVLLFFAALACKTAPKGREHLAAEEYEKYGPDSPMYREYITGSNYVWYYERAVQLSAVYITALFEIYTALSDTPGGSVAARRRDPPRRRPSRPAR